MLKQSEQYCKGQWRLENDGKIGIPAELALYRKSEEKAPVIIYVMGYVGAKQVGREDGETIIRDLLDEGYIVLTLDYLGDARATTPNLDWSIQNIRMDVKNYMCDMAYDELFVYVVPDGYRIVRDILYYDFSVQGRRGTLDEIIKIYNGEQGGFRQIKGHKIPNPDEHVTSIDRCLKPDGTPIDLQLKMDIIYPSQSETQAPMVMISSSTESRLHICCRKKERPLDVGPLMRNCALAIYDHGYTPMSRTDHYGYFSGYFSLQGYTGVSVHTTAARCVKYYADDYGYSKENIAVMGHSKGSLCGILASKHPEKLENWTASPDGYASDDYYGEEAFLTYRDGTPISSNVSVAYRSMGDGAMRRRSYLAEDNAPTMLCCGTADQFGSWNYWYDEVADYEEKGPDYLAIPMSDKGHDYPYEIDPHYGYDRFLAFMDFFTYYLKKNEAPRVLYASAVDGKQVGCIHITRHNGEDGKTFSHATVTTDDKIFVQFLAPVTEESAKKGIALWDAENGIAVEGKLLSNRTGSRWYFEPAKPLAKGRAYEIRVDGSVTSKMNGVAVGQSAVLPFVAE